jgi:hypothetical protein
MYDTGFGFGRGEISSDIFVSSTFAFLLFFDAVHDDFYIVVIPSFKVLVRIEKSFCETFVMIIVSVSC